RESPHMAEHVHRNTGAGALLREGDLPPAQHYIGGAFRGAADRFTDVVDPATEEVIARVPEGTAADVDRAVDAATAARPQWARTVPGERSALLHAVADRIAEHAEALVRLEAANTGKPLRVARDDVDGTIDTFRFMAGALRATTSMAAGEYAENHLSVI